MDQVHWRWLTGLRTSLNTVVGFQIDGSDWTKWTIIPASNLTHSSPIRRSRQLDSAGGGAGSCSRQCVTAEHGSSPEFEFSRGTVVSFRWGLLLRDHIDKGNSIMLTLIDGERQRSPAMVRKLSQCLVMVRAASGEASTPWTRAEASLNYLPASWSSNRSE
jgi:hypothetical protein